MGVSDLNGVGPVMAQRLEAAGLGTVEAIATASIDDLTAVSGVGSQVGARLKTQAQQLVEAAPPPTGPSRGGPLGIRQARVSKSVKKLHRAIPDLAKTKKHAKRLKKSTERMAAWIEDLDRRKVRKRFVAETTKISDEAKKATSSKKDANSLRKHAARIEDAVQQID